MYNRHLPRRRKYQPWLNFNNTLKMLRTNDSFTNRQQLPQKKSMIFFAEMAVFLIAPMDSVFYHALYPCQSVTTRSTLLSNYIYPIIHDRLVPCILKCPIVYSLLVCVTRHAPSKSTTFLGKKIQLEKMVQNVMGLTVLFQCFIIFLKPTAMGKKLVIYLHADNCGGQNKNKTVLAYLAWRCIVGLHRQITFSFMITGLTRVW